MITPLNNFILLKKEQTKEKTIGSIIIPGTNKDDGNIATIVALGDKITNSLLTKGTKIIYRQYSSTNIKVQDEEYLLIKDEDVLAIIR